MEEELTGKISYEILREIIFDYFKDNQGLKLGSASIDYLKWQLANNDESSKDFFRINTEFGETSFDIEKSDIEKVLRTNLASKGYEVGEIKFGSYIEFKYKENSNIKDKPQEKVELDITYNGNIDYSKLRQIIFDYYKENKNMELSSISIDYLKSKLAGQGSSQPFFIKNDGEEERFDIPKEEIEEILKEYLESKGYKLEEIEYKDSVEFKFKKNKVKEKTLDFSVAIEKGDELPEETKTIINEQLEKMVKRENEMQQNGINIQAGSTEVSFEPTKKATLSEEESKVLLEQVKMEEPKKEPLPVSDAPLEQVARENRKYEILKRERAVSEAERSRNRATMFAGLCILGTVAAGLLTGNDINQLVQDELNILKGSWESLGNYFKNLGPLADALGLCAIAFGGKIGIFERKLRNARLDLEDYMSSLEETNELGGNENARTR